MLHKKKCVKSSFLKTIRKRYHDACNISVKGTVTFNLYVVLDWINIWYVAMQHEQEHSDWKSCDFYTKCFDLSVKTATAVTISRGRGGIADLGINSSKIVRKQKPRSVWNDCPGNGHMHAVFPGTGASTERQPQLTYSYNMNGSNKTFRLNTGPTSGQHYKPKHHEMTKTSHG